MEERMLERIARALAAVDGIELGTWAQDWEPWLERARAAVEAMREPTKAMAEAGGEAYDGMSGYDSWQAMIDGVLS